MGNDAPGATFALQKALQASVDQWRDLLDRIFGQPEEHIWRDRYPDQKQGPNSTLKNIVIRYEFFPCVADHEVSESKLKRDCQDQPA